MQNVIVGENSGTVKNDTIKPESSILENSIETSSNCVDGSSAVPKSKAVKNRKNDQCIQQALRSLNRLSTPEEKFTAICAKYADIFDENRKLQATLKEHQKQIATLTKEKDQVRSDLMKAIFTKDKLENLCRELQRQNKEIKEESLQKIREEEQKRKEVSTKFQTTLNEITELMKQDSDKTMKLRDDNIDMTSKLKSIYEQYEIREQQLEKMSKQMAVESQLYEAKIAKLEMETAAEKEVLLREKQQLLLTLTEYQARFQEYQNIEVTLRNQVALYNDKYEEFEKSLTRSNEVFGGFKSEMENMSNKIVKLESETAAWKSRWEKTQKALIEMASEKQKSDQEIVLAAKQMATLHKLCRTLQSERTQLLAKLKQGSSQHEMTQDSEMNLASDVNNLLETKIIEKNLELSNNYSDEKKLNSKSKGRNKLSQSVEKSQSSPKTKLKGDKKHAAASTLCDANGKTSAERVAQTVAANQESKKVDGRSAESSSNDSEADPTARVETTTEDERITPPGKRSTEAEDCLGAASQSKSEIRSNFTARERPATNEEENKLIYAEQKHNVDTFDANPNPNANPNASADVAPPQKLSVSAVSTVEKTASSAQVESNGDTSVSKNSSQTCKKKAPQKRKNNKK